MNDADWQDFLHTELANLQIRIDKARKQLSNAEDEEERDHLYWWINMLDDGRDMLIRLLPTARTKLQTIIDMQQTTLLPDDEAMKLLDYPDLRRDDDSEGRD